MTCNEVVLCIGMHRSGTSLMLPLRESWSLLTRRVVAQIL